ncbi:Class I SAM-dependent methyltransferase [Gammaproteobacteria bacterium]
MQSYKEKNIFSDIHFKHIKDIISQPIIMDKIGLKIGTTYIMFFCEKLLMREHALLLTKDKTKTNVLEIGFGAGVFAKEIVDLNIDSYTVIEPHPKVVAYAKEWARNKNIKINIIDQPWQKAIRQLKEYDIIMYDGWPPDGCDDQDFYNFVSIVCKESLVEDGRFSFFWNGKTLSSFREKVLKSFFKKSTFCPFFIEKLPKEWTLKSNDFLIPILEK